MNNTVTFFGLASISLFGFISNAPANAQIPQTSIQEILIEGEFNQVNQQLNQRLNLNFIYLPYIEESVISTFNIQGAFLDNPNNQVNQGINQNILDFSLSETSLSSFDLNDFLNDDDILNGKQFITQEVSIKGDLNSITQNSSQALTDFTWLDTSIAAIENNNFSDFLDNLLVSQELDSFQFGLQDTLILGDNNIVSQNIDQTFNNYIFTNNNLDSLFDTNAINENIGLDFAQFTIQETFVDLGQNSLITQTINQEINDISFIDTSSFFEQNNKTIVGKNNSVEFDIDAFINGILKDTIVEATQTNSQLSKTIGNENIAAQENVQVLVVSVPEPSFVKVMGLLLFIIGMRSCHKKQQNSNFN